MLSPEEHKFYSEAIASAADTCMKPWKHAVVEKSLDKQLQSGDGEFILRIERRSKEGERFPENDLELEIFRSGNDLNLTIGWVAESDRPILWQGLHSVWMDSVTGKKCNGPVEAETLESFARRLRALFINFNFE